MFILSFVISVLDATAKLQSGILVGNLVSIGNFDQCIAVKDVQTSFGPFSGKHCLTSFTWTNDTFRTAVESFNIITLVSLIYYNITGKFITAITNPIQLCAHNLIYVMFGLSDDTFQKHYLRFYGH